MRAHALTFLMLPLVVVALCGCIDNDRVRVQTFIPGPAGAFTYSARTNAVMSANDDGAAEQIRRDWLAQTLGLQRMCNGGYVVYQRQLVVAPQRPAFEPAEGNPPPGADTDLAFGNTADVVYTGSCL